MLINLAEIAPRLSPDQPDAFGYRPRGRVGQQLGLLVEQKRLGLNVKPILAEAPLLAEWLEYLEQFIPGLFDPRKRVYVNVLLIVPVKEGVVLELCASVGFAKGKVKVLQWDIREAALLPTDRVRAWAVCQFFSLDPKAVEIIVCAFCPGKLPIKQKYAWDERLHAETAARLEAVLTRTSETDSKAEAASPPPTLA